MCTKDESMVQLIAAAAEEYRKQIADPGISRNKTRSEIIRKLELIRQSIKGLMRHQQKYLFEK